MAIDRGEEPDDFDVVVLAKNVERPCAVFAGTPREKDLGFQSGPLGALESFRCKSKIPTSRAESAREMGHPW
jgi:hypothetical protein